MRKRAIIFFHFSISDFSASLSGPLAQVCFSIQRKEKKKKNLLSRDPKSWRLLLLSLRFLCPSPKAERDTRKNISNLRFHFERKREKSRPRKNKIKSANIFTSLFKNAFYILYYIYALRNSLSFILSLRHRCSLSWGCFFLLLSSKNDVGNNVQTRDAVFFFRQRQQQHESFEIENFIFFFFEK